MSVINDLAKVIGFILVFYGLIYFIYFTGDIVWDTLRTDRKIELNQPFNLKDFTINYEDIFFTKQISIFTADKGYKFAVIKVIAKNNNYKEKSFPLDDFDADIELKVDKGYRYEPHYNTKSIYLVRPGDTKIGYFVFEILEDTFPVELYVDKDWGDNFLITIPRASYKTIKSLKLTKDLEWEIEY